MSEGSFEKERELEKDGNNLSITAVVHLLRRGDKAEVLQAADKMNDFLDEVTIGTEDSEMHLVEMHKSNALQTLLSAFTRCTAAAWTECEIPVSRAIAHLVAIEDVSLLKNIVLKQFYFIYFRSVIGSSFNKMQEKFYQHYKC
jgi:hypothetical protein